MRTGNEQIERPNCFPFRFLPRNYDFSTLTLRCIYTADSTLYNIQCIFYRSLWLNLSDSKPQSETQFSQLNACYGAGRTVMQQMRAVIVKAHN